jgi:hypothetical protein
MKTRRGLLPMAVVVLIAASLAGGYELLVPHHHAPPGIALTNLSSVHQLQTRFNRDRGEPRLILIFSPT